MIKTLLNRYKNIPLESDRVKFVLAAYNAGFGHLDDAMKLAGKYDLDPYKWDDNVKVMFENLTNQSFIGILLQNVVHIEVMRYVMQKMYMSVMLIGK